MLRHVQRPRQNHGCLHATSTPNTKDDWVSDPDTDPLYSSSSRIGSKLIKRHRSHVWGLGKAKFKESNPGTEASVLPNRLYIEPNILRILGFPIHPQGSGGYQTVVFQCLLELLSNWTPKDRDAPAVDAGPASHGNTQNCSSSYHGSLQSHSSSKAGEISKFVRGGSKRGRRNDSPDDRGKKRLPSTPVARVSTSEDELLFACPIEVHDPDLAWCGGRRRIVDVRQHIQRKHRQTPFCPRCGLPFGRDSTEDDRMTHINQNTCEAPAFPVHPTGVTQDKLTAITRCAQHKTTRSDDERWYEVWDILFPGSPRPTSTRVQVTSESSTHNRNLVSRYLNSPSTQSIIDEYIAGEFEGPSRIQMQVFLNSVFTRAVNGFVNHVEREGGFRPASDAQGMHGVHSLAIVPPDPPSSSHINPAILESSESSWGVVDNPHGMPEMTQAAPSVIPPRSLAFYNAYPSEPEEEGKVPSSSSEAHSGIESSDPLNSYL